MRSELCSDHQKLEILWVNSRGVSNRTLIGPSSRVSGNPVQRLDFSKRPLFFKRSMIPPTHSYQKVHLFYDSNKDSKCVANTEVLEQHQAQSVLNVATHTERSSIAYSWPS